MIGANDTARDKPAPAPMIAALEGTGQTLGETVWYVGDTALDMEFAHNTGCRQSWSTPSGVRQRSSSTTRRRLLLKIAIN